MTAHVKRHGVDMRGKNGARVSGREELARSLCMHVCEFLHATPRLNDALPLPGFQALHFASCYGRVEIASFLLHTLGADVNAQTARGNTPLHIACFENFVPIIQLLLHHGADCTILNWQQKSPVDMAPRAITLQAVTRAVCARSGGLLADSSGKLWRHYYHLFGLQVGADEEQLGPAFKQTIRRIFMKRDASDEERHVDLQEACEAYLVLRSSRNRKTFEQGPSPNPIHIEFINQQYLDSFIKQQMCEAIKTLTLHSVASFRALQPEALGGASPHAVDASALRPQTGCMANSVPGSPLPELSALTASPSDNNGSLLMSPTCGKSRILDKAEGPENLTTPITISSPVCGELLRQCWGTQTAYFTATNIACGLAL